MSLKDSSPPDKVLVPAPRRSFLSLLNDLKMSSFSIPKETNVLSLRDRHLFFFFLLSGWLPFPRPPYNDSFFFLDFLRNFP